MRYDRVVVLLPPVLMSMFVVDAGVAIFIVNSVGGTEDAAPNIILHPETP